MDDEEHDEADQFYEGADSLAEVIQKTSSVSQPESCNGISCSNGGTCVEEQASDGQKNFIRVYCTSDKVNTCLNNGELVFDPVSNEEYCLCDSGYEGNLCQVEKEDYGDYDEYDEYGYEYENFENESVENLDFEKTDDKNVTPSTNSKTELQLLETTSLRPEEEDPTIIEIAMDNGIEPPDNIMKHFNASEIVVTDVDMQTHNKSVQESSDSSEKPTAENHLERNQSSIPYEFSDSIQDFQNLTMGQGIQPPVEIVKHLEENPIPNLQNTTIQEVVVPKIVPTSEATKLQPTLNNSQESNTNNSFYPLPCEPEILPITTASSTIKPKTIHQAITDINCKSTFCRWNQKLQYSAGKNLGAVSNVFDQLSNAWQNSQAVGILNGTRSDNSFQVEYFHNIPELVVLGDTINRLSHSMGTLLHLFEQEFSDMSNYRWANQTWHSQRQKEQYKYDIKLLVSAMRNLELTKAQKSIPLKSNL